MTCTCLSCVCRRSWEQQVSSVPESGATGPRLGSLQCGEVTASHSGDNWPAAGQWLARRAASHIVWRNGATGTLRHCLRIERNRRNADDVLLRNLWTQKPSRHSETNLRLLLAFKCIPVFRRPNRYHKVTIIGLHEIWGFEGSDNFNGGRLSYDAV